MTRTGSSARPLPQRDESNFMDWMQENARVLMAATIVVAALLLGAYLYRGTQAAKAQKAEQALGRAEQSIASGNLPLAQTDLRRVVTAYNGTSAAATAAMLLAQMSYDQGKYQEGIDQLEKTAGSGAAKPLRASIQGLIADGYMGLGKPAEAAKRYQDAATSARFDAEKSQHLASAARAYVASGNTEAAREIWEKLASDPTGATSGEARVRLGELLAKPAGGT